MIVTTYRRFVEQLTAGISFCRGYFGERYTGVIGLVGDLLAEGARQAIIARMPGHPEQAEDSLNQCGADAGLFRYRGETFTSWSARVSNPWPQHEQAGTDIQLYRAIREWGNIVFPATWDDAGVHILESVNGIFTVFLDAGITTWLPSWNWGDGSTWGQTNLLYGITNALPEDVDALRRIVRSWKASRSKASGCIVLSGHVWGQPGLVWGGFNYGNGNAVVFRF